MKKEFFPDIEFNRKRRNKLLIFYVLLMLLPGGFSAYLFISGQFMTGAIMAALLVLLLSMIPSSLSQYPIKRKPLIVIEGKDITFADKTTAKASDIVSVSVCIDVPQVAKTADENKEFLLKMASEKPTEPVLGACDVTIKNNKGKEVVKYSIVDDAIGALEAFLSLGIRKYRILYNQKKLTEEAKYKMVGSVENEVKLEDLSEKEKMMQLL